MIAIITFKRPQGLETLLASIAAMEEAGPFRVVVVDNDPEETARELVMRKWGFRVDYETEPRAGIAAARNRCLDLIADDDEFVVFVDDDEEVSSCWLGELVAAQRRTAADVVGGPVISRFPDCTPLWIRHGEFIQRKVLAEESSDGIPATNNTLVAVRAIRQNANVRFNEQFSFTGGSDTEWFVRLIESGEVRFVWTERGVVYEDVEAARVTFSWVWKRSARAGNVLGRIRIERGSRARVFTGGLARVAIGLAGTLLDLLRGRGLQRDSFVRIPTGIGMLQAVFGRAVVEYRRR